MVVYVNQTKNSSALTPMPISNPATWADTIVTWADAGIGWASYVGTTYAKQTKNTSVLTNQTKN
jgi:hypothetical protein